MTMEGGVSAATRSCDVNHPCRVVLKILVVMSDLLADDRVFIGAPTVPLVQTILTEATRGSGVWVTVPLTRDSSFAYLIVRQ